METNETEPELTRRDPGPKLVRSINHFKPKGNQNVNASLFSRSQRSLAALFLIALALPRPNRTNNRGTIATYLATAPAFGQRTVYYTTDAMNVGHTSTPYSLAWPGAHLQPDQYQPGSLYEDASRPIDRALFADRDLEGFFDTYEAARIDYGPPLQPLPHVDWATAEPAHHIDPVYHPAANSNRIIQQQTTAAPRADGQRVRKEGAAK